MMRAREKSDGIIQALLDLPVGEIVTEDRLAGILGKCRASIKRAVRRGELPRPFKWFGRQSWTVGAILDHVSALQDRARRNTERAERRIASLG